MVLCTVSRQIQYRQFRKQTAATPQLYDGAKNEGLGLCYVPALSSHTQRYKAKQRSSLPTKCTPATKETEDRPQPCERKSQRNPIRKTPFHIPHTLPSQSLTNSADPNSTDPHSDASSRRPAYKTSPPPSPSSPSAPSAHP